MKIKVTKLTDKKLLDKACSFTVGKDVDVQSMHKFYKSEHSPIRTQMFCVEMYDIPSFVSVHLVRHHTGVEHFVKSNRTDRGGSENVDRYSPVNHLMILNAQSLINIARKRLCTQASLETREVMNEIKAQIKKIDLALSDCMVPECDYKGGICYEFSCCGRCPKG